MIQLALSLAIAFAQPPPVVTFQSLIREMNDSTTLARFPDVPYRQLQATSYDRSRTGPGDPKTWFANQDYGQFIRTEENQGRKEWVVMEHDGPGALTRIWTPLDASKDNMLVRFYFDGSTTPQIEEKFNDLMRGNSFVKAPFAFIAWPRAGETSGVGADFYLPIPFAKSCKITMSEVPFYYSFSYRAYPLGVPVETFDVDAYKEHPAQYAFSSNLEFKPDIGHDYRYRGAQSLKTATDFSLALPKGSSAVKQLNVIVPKDITSEQLRSTIVEMTFDGERTVWCPLGEFFGCGVELHSVSDRYRHVSDSGFLSCTWPMPYQRSAKIHIYGLGTSKVPIEAWASTAPWTWDGRSLHFHATWHNQSPLNTRPMVDWNYVSATGRGVYVGDTLTVDSPSAAWYGEGDEKVYVDGEKFPSHLGTGTEDYYGYAWGMADYFSSDFISMPARDRFGRDNWTGITTTSRVRGLDAIPFGQSLKFDMEIWDWADCKLAYSAATFWYGTPGTTTNRTPDPTGALQPLPEIGIKGALECETMPILSNSDDVVIGTQGGGVENGAWSGGAQLFIQSKQVGDFTEIKFPVAHSGVQHVILHATKSYDYGIIRLSIDGKVAKEVDLWNDKPALADAIDLGAFDLRGGTAVLRIEVISTNPQSRGPRYYCGLDCIVLKPR